jgi:hypothetical protein
VTPRSDKVTVLAWNLILVGGLTIGLAGLQLVVVTLLLPPGALQMALDEVAVTMPAVRDAQGIIDHIAAILAGIAGLGVATLVAGIGLLRRRDWARRLVIALLWITIAAHVAGAIAPFFGSQVSVLVLSVVLGVLVCGFSAWLIVFLRSPDTRGEFDAG